MRRSKDDGPIKLNEEGAAGLIQTDEDRQAIHQDAVAETDAKRFKKSVSERPGASSIHTKGAPELADTSLRPKLGRSDAAASKPKEGAALEPGAGQGKTAGQAAVGDRKGKRKLHRALGREKGAGAKEPWEAERDVEPWAAGAEKEPWEIEPPGHRDREAEAASTLQPRYGTLEAPGETAAVGGDVAADAVALDTTPLIRMDDPKARRAQHRALIRDEGEVSAPVKDSADGAPTIELGLSDSDIIHGSSSARGWRRGRGYLSSEMAMALSRMEDGEYQTDVAVFTAKHTIRGSVAAGRIAAEGTREGKALIRHTSDLRASLRSGEMTKVGAAKSFGLRAGKGVGATLKTAGSSAKDILARDVEEFHADEDDLGLQAIQKPKDLIVHTRNTYQAITRSTKTVKRGARAAQKVAKAVVNFVSNVAKQVVSNPVVLKVGLAIAAALLVIVLLTGVIGAIVSAVTSMMSVKSDGWDLTQAYLYVTQLDTNMQYKITHVSDDQTADTTIDAFRYIVTVSPGTEGVEMENYNIHTDADRVLMYLDCKYGDYTFNEDIRTEIYDLHTTLWKETKRETEQVTAPDPDTGAMTEQMWCYVYLSVVTLDDYLDDKLTADEKELFDAMQEVGPYTFRAELSSPFPGEDLSAHITSRFGWRIHPTSGDKSQHNAIDIAMSEGTPIHACMSGTAQVPTYSASYGNYARIVDEDGNYTLYAHMSSLAVANGQAVTVGDVIGYVGSTGNSTGPHLHLEYYADGHSLNPLFFVEQER